MFVKNDVLFEFQNIRSYERVDLLCSLLDLCLPYELRFLGTCLEFLGKRDFYELREDERDANNLNHVLSFRSLMEENTRRKLVLYVSLLKSCNTECANVFSDTLTALCPEAVSQISQSDPENAEKVLDELLLLYTIALKHPAFNVHQKTDFAAHLSRLKEEDQNLSRLLCSDEDNSSKLSQLPKPTDFIPETPCKPIDTSVIGEVRDSSSQVPVNSQNNQFTCHVISESVYTSAVLPSALHQASASCLNPAHMNVSCITTPPAPTLTESHKGDASMRLGVDPSGPLIAVGLPVSPVTSNVIMGSGPGPGPGPGPGMVMQLPPSTSQCMMAHGDMGMQKSTIGHPNMMMCMPPESMQMPYSGHAHFGMMVPIVGHIPGPPLAPPPGAPLGHASMNKPVTSSAQPLPIVPAPAPNSSSTLKSVPLSCASYSLPPASVSSCLTTGMPGPQVCNAKEGNRREDAERQNSAPSSPVPTRGASPSPSSKTQVSSTKGGAHSVSLQPSHTASNQSSQLSYVPNMYMSSEAQHPAKAIPINQSHQYQNHVVHVGNHHNYPQSMNYMTTKPPCPWIAPSENLKEAIVREMPKYKGSLQNLSPDELLHMSDDQLKELGLPISAIQQLRSIVNKLNSNGINCPSRNDGAYYHENSGGSRRRHHFPSENNHASGAPTPQSYGQMASSTFSGGSNSMSNGGFSNKGGKSHQQLTNQVRALQLEDDARRPCSNSSSTSDCSSGSHSPPETPSLPLISEVPSDHFDRGYSGKDSGAESWNSGTSEDKNREDRLHDVERPDDRTRPSIQPPGFQRNRSRGMSKAPPGIPTIPRGRVHPMADKNRRDPVSPMNGVPSEMNNPPPQYTMSVASGMPNSVTYPAPAASTFLSSPFTTMHAFHRFQSGSFLPTGTPYPFPPNGEMWNPFTQPPQPAPQYVTSPIVAFSPAHPPPKLSCYNCGRQGHQGSDCKESTFEEITQQGQYHLDYKPGDFRETEK